ncbi:hypothetical protein [Capnocytophaga canis]|uniref:hypothetical protein n=1 Tax=Capnocytophaga canis TaxID=1848903 RepID=UPI0021754BC6|nr:hypothetical protein [Capnocytophaga canis]
MSKKGAEDKEKLKNEYRKYTITDKEYLAPWVSIRQGQTITLTMKIKKKRNFKTQRIELSHSDFTFSPDKITPETFAKSKKVPIQITCKTTFAQDQVVELKTENGEMVGAIAFMENKVKELKHPVRWVVVDFNNDDYRRIIDDVKNNLQYSLDRAFNPALISANVTPPIQLSIPYYDKMKALDTNFINGITDKILRYFIEQVKNRDCFEANDAVRYKNENKVALLANLLTLQKRGVYTPDTIFLFTTYLKCRKEKEDGMIDNNNGFNIQEGIIMFLKNEDKNPAVDIPHEIMHALGLPHTFKENSQKDSKKKHIFNQRSTKNYMDYQNPKKHTQKWQWELMRKSNFLKTILLLFSLLFFSCKTAYNKTNQEYCQFNDSITNEEKILDLNKYPKTDRDTIIDGKKIWVIDDLNGFCKFNYTIYSDIKITKDIVYDTLKRISNVYSRIGDQKIGREFFYDKEGDITKIVNHDKDGEICGLLLYQKMYRKLKNKINKEEGRLSASRTIRDGENVWRYGYYNRRYKGKIVYVNPKTGRIIARGRFRIVD